MIAKAISGFLGAVLLSTPLVAQSQEPTFKFERIEFALPMGKEFARERIGLVCLSSGKHHWEGASSFIQREMFERAFHEAATENGIPLAGDPSNMFGDRGFEDADYLIGASVYSLNLDACAPQGGFGNTSKVKGSGTVGIEWQVFSKVEERIVLRERTTASFKLDRAEEGGVYRLMLEPFRDNVRQLAGLEAMKSLFVSEGSDR